MALNCEILMDSPTGAYYSGQMVNGRVVFDLLKVTQIRGVHLTAKGYCNVHWSTSHSRRERDRTVHYTVPHESYEEYICLKIYLFGSKNAEHTLNPGKYDYPFSFQLPDSCPSSFQGSQGHVRYEVRAFIDQLYETEELFREFMVHAPLDLNLVPCREPVSFDFDKSYCCWCMSSGSSETVVKIPVRGYCPGQIIPIEITCQNRSGVEIDAIRFAIKKDITYHATREPDTKNERESIGEQTKGPVPPHSDRNFTVEMPVPAIDVYNLSTCSFIDLKYEFKVTVEPSGCHSNDDDSCELIIGTIPLVGYQDNVPNPLQDQLPQITVTPQNFPPVNVAPYPQPVIAQPVSTYPSNTPYPSNPYPPIQPSPYPNHSPYPQNTPYPVPQANVTPYPSALPGVQPFPQPNNGPYSAPNNVPYPAPVPQPGNAPYPSSQPVTAPYPIATMPHHGNSLPQSSPLLKTGNVGFVTGGLDPASMPLLPMGAVPYPARPSSPFVDASAPTDAPATPTEKPPEPNSSPYNPEFMNADKKEETK